MASERKTILLCILNWGIGHAARCVPLVRKWMSENKRVVIASDGAALQMLQMEFPDLEFELLPSYSVIYDTGSNMVWAMAKQLPKFISAINLEHQQLQKLIEKHQPELVVSDSRFGCHTKKVKCVFITHQLHLIMPMHFKWMEPAINFFNHRQIAKFVECWVPDEAGEKNLSGKLSRPLLPNAKYIGVLSRFTEQKSDVRSRMSDDKETSSSIVSRHSYSHSHPSSSTSHLFHIAAILSGPEPQRSILEKQLLEEMKSANKKCLLVRGIPANEKSKFSVAENVIVKNYLNAGELREVIFSSNTIICRSGYSTIMDLWQLKPEAKIIFIPTPGQTEQEYLAERMKQIGFGLVAKTLSESSAELS